MIKKILWLLALLPSLAFGGLEDLTGGSKYIDDLVATNPLSNDAKSEGDDHLRGIKNVLKNTFPNVTGAVTATQTELNYTDVTTPGTVQASKAIVTDSNGDITNVDINGGTIDGTVIGGSSAAAGSFTTITASSTITSSAGSVSAQSTAGGDLYLQDTDAATNEKIWSIHGEAGTVYLRTRTDANGAGETAIQCTRSGTAIDTCSIENGGLTVKEAASFQGDVDLSNGASDIIRIPSTLPSLKFYENDQGTNSKVWSFYGQAAAFGLRLEDDSYGAGEIAWTCSRSGTTVGTCTFDNGNVAIDEGLSVAGTISHTAACDSGYARAGVGFCRATGGTSTAMTTSCSSITVPASAVAILVQINATALSANVGSVARSALAILSTSGTCASTAASASAGSYEFSAISSGTLLGAASTVTVLPTSSTIYSRVTLDAGAQSQGSFRIIGYWD